MRKIGLALVLVLLLSPIVLARPEQITIPSKVLDNNSYNLSFNLGDNTKYSKILKGPESDETYAGQKFEFYTLQLKFEDNSIINIILQEYDTPMDTTTDASKQLIKGYFQELRIQNPNLYDRVIDGQLGEIGIGSRGTSTLYHAIYWPFQMCLAPNSCMGFTSCEIRSLSDWDTTKNLLNTIHIGDTLNKIKNTQSK